MPYRTALWEAARFTKARALPVPAAAGGAEDQVEPAAAPQPGGKPGDQRLIDSP